MSLSKFKPGVFVLPEDDANRQLANGFLKDSRVNSRHVQVLVDFDGRGSERLEEVLASVDEGVRDRVFVLGTRDEPEKMKRLGSYEQIGERLAAACRDDAQTLWKDEQLARRRSVHGRIGRARGHGPALPGHGRRSSSAPLSWTGFQRDRPRLPAPMSLPTVRRSTPSMAAARVRLPPVWSSTRCA